MYILENEPLNLNELIRVVDDMKKHWVGTYLVRVFISCYRGKKSPIDLRKFVSLDHSNQTLFMQIIHMRSFPGWSDENLYQCEIRLKKLVGIR
jgi:hypothetical protein